MNEQQERIAQIVEAMEMKQRVTLWESDGDAAKFRAALTAARSLAQPAAPIGWLYDWLHSSALGKPDEHFTSFTTDEAHAKQHDNARPVYAAPQPAQEGQALAQLRSENAVLVGLLRDCDAVLRTIEADDSDETEDLSNLRMAVEHATSPCRHKGALL